MKSKEELKSMIDMVCFKLHKTQEELATDMDYGKTYISEMLSPTGKVTSKFIKKFTLQYGKILDNPNSDRWPKISFDFDRETLIKEVEQLKALTRVLRSHVASLEVQVTGLRHAAALDKIDEEARTILRGLPTAG